MPEFDPIRRNILPDRSVSSSVQPSLNEAGRANRPDQLVKHAIELGQSGGTARSSQQPDQSSGRQGPVRSLTSAASARRQSIDLLPWADRVVRASAHRPHAAQPNTEADGAVRVPRATGPIPNAKDLWRQDAVIRKRRRSVGGVGGAAALDRAASIGNHDGSAATTGPIVVPALGRPHRVVVVGAGFAGIAAALELQRLGVEVIVLEVRRERAWHRERRKFSFMHATVWYG